MRRPLTRRGAHRRGKKAVSISAIAALACIPVEAANKTWIGPSGNWSTSADWSLPGQPVNGDSVTLTSGVNGVVVVTYDAAAAATSLAQLTINTASAGGSITFAQALGSLTINGSEFVGTSRTGAWNLSGGTHTIQGAASNGLFFGLNRFSSGSGSMSGDAILNLPVSSNEEVIGFSGVGTFTQSGGNNNTAFLYLGYNTFGSGVYSQSGGSLTVRASEVVGDLGSGVFNLSGGTQTATNLYVGVSSAGFGTYSMSSGASLIVSNMYLGSVGSGSFNMTGGDATIFGIDLGADGGTGTVNFSGGTLTTQFIGVNSASAFNQTGGTVVITNSGTTGLFIGQSTAAASYALSGGGLLSATSATEYVGYGGVGSFNQSGGTHNAQVIDVGYRAGTNSGTGTYTLTGGTLNVALGQTIGYDGSGTFNQSGGVNSTVNLYLGSSFSTANSGTGVYSLSNGASLAVSGDFILGVSGNGTLNQTGGDVTASGLSLSVGGLGGTGTVNLSGGTLSVIGDTYVGAGGVGVFNQSGGTHTATNLYIASGASSPGTYTLSGNGVLNVSAVEYVGYAGSGAYNQTGGDATASGGIAVAANPGATGLVNLSGGVVTTPSVTVNTGGTFNLMGGNLNTDTVTLSGGAFNWSSGTLAATTYVQSGGTFTVTLPGFGLIVGTSPTATASYTQTGGIFFASGETIGYGSGRGALDVSGGLHSFSTSSANLNVGLGVGASGSVTLSDNGVISGAFAENIGYQGAGSFLQSGGTNSTLQLKIGILQTGSGLYTQTGGTLTASEEVVGNETTGIFNQSGGTNNASFLRVGDETFLDVGTYSISNGASLAVSGSMFVGGFGRGTLNQTGGGVTASALYLGGFGGTNGGTAAVNLSGGSLVSGSVTINGAATFTHSGGTVTINSGGSNGLFIGNTNGAVANYVLSGSATLAVTGSENVGLSGNGAFSQSGGSNSASFIVYVGQNFGANGTMVLSGGTLNSGIGTYVGLLGNGTFIQTGGTHTTPDLEVARNAGSTGSYSMSGDAVLNATQTEVVGGTFSNGGFSQSGGTNTTPSLYLGFFNPSAGTYTLSGAGVLNVTDSAYVGYSGTGVLNQSGGTHTVGQSLYVGFNTGSVGIYNLSGGSLFVTNGAEYLGNNGVGTFTQTGGTHTAMILNLGNATGSTGNYNLSGGTLNVTQAEKVGLSGNSTFNQSAGTHTVGIGMYLGGAWAVAGTQRGTATYNMSGGTLSMGTPTGPSAEGFLTVGAHDDNGFFNQSGGVVTINGKPAPVTWPNDGLFLGADLGTTGTYNLSNGATLIVNSDEFIGSGGTGIFNQVGGLHSVTGANGIFLGAFSDTSSANIPTGIFNLSGGTASAANVYIGGGYPGGVTNTIAAAGYGSLAVYGGTLNVAGVIRIFDTRNDALVASGMALYGGTANANTYIQNGGAFTQSGGVFNVTSTNAALLIGDTPGVAATFTLSNNGALSVAGDAYIGHGGVGVFSQFGGTHTANNLYVGSMAGSPGTYTLSGGTASFTNAFVGGGATAAGDVAQLTISASGSMSASGALVLWNNGSSAVNLAGGSLSVGTLYTDGTGANFHWTAGALNITKSDLYIDSADYSPLGTAVTLTNLQALDVSQNEDIASRGSGSFIQTGGTHVVGQSLTIGLSSTSLGSGSGTYTLGGGTLTAGSETVANGRNGSFSQSGGVNTTMSLILAAFSNVTGTYVLSAGVLSASNTVTVGSGGTGTFNQTSGTHTAGELDVGGQATGLGTYNLSGASSVLNVANTGSRSELIGEFGTGTFNHGGGLNATRNLYVGAWAGSVGNYNMSNGATLSTVGEYVGYQGVGHFNQSGGFHNVVFGSALYIGNQGTAIGTYNLSGGTLNVGYELLMGAGASTTASFSFSGGTLNSGANSLGDVSTNNAVFTQTGGSFIATDHTVNPFGFITVGDDFTGHGIYNLSGGSSTILTDVMLAGWRGTGTFNQSDGSVTVTQNLDQGNQTTALGTYNLSGGTLTAAAETVGRSGTGTLTQTGGINSVGTGGLAIALNPGAHGTYALNGGTLNAPSILNNGTFHQSGGTLNGGALTNNATFISDAGVASLGVVSGTGSLSVGNGPGTTSATMQLSQFAQNSVSIGNNGTIFVTPAVPRATNTTTSLTITGAGLLDLGNHALLVDNAATPEPLVRQYLHNAYNADASGIGNWLGNGGITSSDAIASHNGPSPDFRISIGYVNGNYANDPLISGPIPGQETLPTNRTLIRPALYGDLNLDGKVDDTDLAIFSGLGQYNQPTDKFGWLGGDLNQDGKVDDTDLLIFSGAGNYNGPTYGAAGAGASHTSATPTLTGHTEANGDIILSSTTGAGVPGDGVLDFVYDPSTGHLALSYDGDPRVTAAQPFQVVRFKSAGAHFIPANFNQTAFGAGVTATTAALNGTASGSNSVPDGYDMGAVLPTGLTVADLTSDLTLQWNVFGGGLTLKNGDVVVPEPTVLTLISLAVGGSLTKRRRHQRLPVARPKQRRTFFLTRA